MPEMKRCAFEHNGLTLSYLDSVVGKPIVALHAHWMEGATFRQLAKDLAPNWRIIALDQRGHGYSDHASDYSRAAYLGDIAALLDHLGLERAVVLGNSLGGANAYQFAARHPVRVIAMVIEDIGAVIDDDPSIVLGWQGIFPTREALEEKIGDRLVPALSPSIRETSRGWELAFDANDTVASQTALNGDYWDDWLTSCCPALLIRGEQSRVSDPQHFGEMASRRPDTQLVTLDGGHVVHFDNPVGFTTAVRHFLEKLSIISQMATDEKSFG